MATSSPPPALTAEHRQIIVEIGKSISNKLGRRITVLANSSSLADFYEALTADIYLASSACSLQYVTREKRQESFVKARWELLGKTQTIEDMVESGFFCMGDADHAKCFFCDLGLRDWERGDNPEVEHAKFSPLCFYLKSCLGFDGLRALTPPTTKFPPSYARQDHNQLLRSIGEQFSSRVGWIACRIGLDDTKVLLSIARNFIRFRQSWSLKELVSSVQAEWEREVLNDPSNPPQFLSHQQLGALVREFYRVIESQ